MTTLSNFLVKTCFEHAVDNVAFVSFSRRVLPAGVFIKCSKKQKYEKVKKKNQDVK